MGKVDKRSRAVPATRTVISDRRTSTGPTADRAPRLRADRRSLRLSAPVPQMDGASPLAASEASDADAITVPLPSDSHLDVSRGERCVRRGRSRTRGERCTYTPSLRPRREGAWTSTSQPTKSCCVRRRTSFSTATWPTSALREVMDGPLGFDRHIWAQGAELGWTSMLVPEKFDGGSVSGEGVCDLGIIAEELGRFLLAGPVLPTNIVAYALARSGSDEMAGLHLPAIAAGRRDRDMGRGRGARRVGGRARRRPRLEQREGLPARPESRHRSRMPTSPTTSW